MTLDSYLTERGITTAEFAKRIETSFEAVRRYRAGLRVPERGVMQKIVNATGGAVSPNDFFSPVAAAE